MRINEGFLSGARIDRPNGVDSTPLQPPALRSASAAPQDAGDSSSAGELARLVALATAIDEIRPGVVEDVSQRLGAGAYATRDAAERTAEAILNAAD